MNLFDCLKAISYNKKDLTIEPDFEKAYDSFLVNRYLSMLPDTVHLGQFMNMFPDIPKRYQFLFLQGAMEKENRFFKYVGKDKKDPNIKIIMDYYQVGEDKARVILKMLDKKQIKNIKSAYGGKRK